MGCWNETCGITQLPILSGDAVRMFLILDHAPLDYCYCSISEAFIPYGVPLKGHYDEYGSLYDIKETISSNMTLENLKEQIVPNHGRAGKFDLENCDWQSIIEWMTSEQLLVAWSSTNNYRQKFLEIEKNTKDKDNIRKEEEKIVHDSRERNGYLRTMYHMMVHEDIYQSMIDSPFRHKMWKDTLLYLQEYDRVKNTPFGSLNLLSKLQHRNSFADLFASGRTEGEAFIRKFLYKIEEGVSDEELKQLSEDLSDFNTFSRSMYKMRKLWTPQAGKGSQDINHELYIKLAHAIIKHAEEAEKRFDS